MPKVHTVAQAECMSSIAERYGFFWETLWNDPDNAELKQLRGDPNLLAPGDRVHVPDLRVGEASGAVDARHTFKIKGVPALFELRVVFDGEPRAGESYVLDVDGVVFEGATDGDGWIKEYISPRARKGTLTLRDGAEVHELALGHLDPIDTVSGVQGRLANLGYYDGPVDGRESDALSRAVRDFQDAEGLEMSGTVDAATRDKLEEVHAR